MGHWGPFWLSTQVQNVSFVHARVYVFILASVRVSYLKHLTRS